MKDADRPHGKWIEITKPEFARPENTYKTYYMCSNCKTKLFLVPYFLVFFCPWCGADMHEKGGYKSSLMSRIQPMDYTLGEYEEMTKPLDREVEQEPCEDAISRQATVEFLEKHAEIYEDVRVKMGFKASASLINNRNNLPPVTPTQNWIPTSERQPEENGNYLAFYRSSDGTAALKFVMVDHCDAGGGWLHEESGKKSYKKVIAWMPLPEPYKAGSEEV